ncbi:MAG: DNA alkylation repair protein [Planctomycetes bacterium]|nr:DNA alkylation repair protein [Planctomycetota bacterium]
MSSRRLPGGVGLFACAAPHPIARFRAPAAITRGQPLKDLLSPALVALIGESFAAADAAFPAARFAREAVAGLGPLALMPRAAHIAAALGRALPADPTAAVERLLAALGPELPAEGGMGLRPFFYLPHSAWIAAALPGHPDLCRRAARALTTRFTAEFCLRPLLERTGAAGIAALAGWCDDPSPHVRRAASEATRPRLPWAARLEAAVRDPAPGLALLERLRDDPSAYVRRSVANHLGDVAKDHPDLAVAVCARWLDEAAALPAPAAAARRALVRHALRLPARHGDAAALRLCRAAGRMRRD